MGSFAKLSALVLFLCVSVALTQNASAQSSDNNKRPTGFIDVVVNDQPHPDALLAEKLLSNIKKEWMKLENKEPFYSAKKIEFRGQNGKALLFVAVAHPATCGIRDCFLYVFVKDDDQSNWKWGFQTVASAFYVDTSRQQTAFPRILTQKAFEPYEYWVFDSDRYRRAGM